MSDVQHNYWDGINHPYRMLEKHYNENAWNLVKNNEVSVWGSFEPVKFEEEIDWGMDPFDNETWCFYFNGLSWLYSYLWSIDNSGEGKETLFSIVKQYHSHINSENPNKMVWFDHSTSDRLSMLSVISLHPIYQEASEEIKIIFKQLIELHIEKIKDFKSSRKWVNSNHGVFHSLALLNASTFYSNFEERTEIEKIGLEYLSETLQTILCLEECVSLEQSAYYHQLAISLIESLQEENLENIGLKKDEFISKLIDNNYWITSNDRKLIAMGDTSVISNIRDEHSPNNIPTNHFKTFRNLGGSFVKYNTSNGYNHFSFSHSELRAPHGHFDSLSITLSKGNKEFIIDSGGPYRYGNKLRFEYFMSSIAHNVAIINNQKHELGANLIFSNEEENRIFTIEAEHTGYFPIIHRRKCVYVKEQGVKIIDSFSGINSSTKIDLLWHLNPNSLISENLDVVSVENQKLFIRTNYDCAKNIIYGDDDDFLQSWITTGIGKKDPSPTLVFSLISNTDCKLETFFEYDDQMFFNSLNDSSDSVQINPNFEKLPFNEDVISDYISGSSKFWNIEDAFGRRNLWKIRKSQELIEKNFSHKKICNIIYNSVNERIKHKIPTIYIISNGESGANYLGGIIGSLPGYKHINEVYIPTCFLDDTFEKSITGALIEMVNLVHIGDFDKDRLKIPINTMNLRYDTPLNKIIQFSPNSKFIKLIRNPIDIAYLRTISGVQAKNGIIFDDELNNQCIFTKNNFKRMSSNNNKIESLEIRFEDLIYDSVSTMNMILTKLGSNITEERVIDWISSIKIPQEEILSSDKIELTIHQKKILNDNLSKTCEDLGYDIPEYAKL